MLTKLNDAKMKVTNLYVFKMITMVWHTHTHPLYNPRTKLQDTLTHTYSYYLWQSIQGASSSSHHVKENHSLDLESILVQIQRGWELHTIFDPFLAALLNTPVILYHFHAQDRND